MTRVARRLVEKRRRMARRLYLAAWAITGGLGVVATVYGWKRYPAAVLGVAWPWFAGTVLLTWFLLGLDAAVALGTYPPHLPVSVELRRWLFHALSGFLTGLAMTLVVSPLFVGTAWVLHTVKPWNKHVAGLLLFALWIGWFIGIGFLLAWLSGQEPITRLRTPTTRMRQITEQDVMALLRAAELPEAQKAAFLQALRREGLTVALAREMLAALRPRIQASARRHPGRTARYAALAQTLELWLELRNQNGL